MSGMRGGCLCREANNVATFFALVQNLSIASVSAPRYLERVLSADLAQKMVFLTGPRQVGKTRRRSPFLQDAEGFDVRLSYLRDRTDKEVDFIVTVKD